MAKINNINVNGETYGIGSGIYAEMGISEERFIELLDRDFYVPTRDAAPTEDTLTYIDTDLSVCDYRIGQQCRVADAESDQGYVFYQLYDITSDGKAVWAEVGSGTALPGNVYLTGASYYNESVRTIKQGILSDE